MHQSPKHPDGWGVAYYVHGSPHIIRSLSTAINDSLFKTVSCVVRSQSVIAHLRKKTTGSSSVLDTHPFQYGKWVFAHNGNIKKFDHHLNNLIKLIDEEFSPFILGHTDSEIIFYIIMSQLKMITSDLNPSLDQVVDACQQAVEKIISIVGPINPVDSAAPSETFLTFLLSDGEITVGHQGGKSLYYSTHKGLCPDRDTCPSYSAACEHSDSSGYVTHLLFSSEPINGDNVWEPMKVGELIAVDSQMHLKRNISPVI
jgi:glutamine amidotransferase